MVAAVAGLVALAVVLVQNVVGDTAERVKSNDARQTAADLAVTELTRRAQAQVPETGDDAGGLSQPPFGVSGAPAG